jgi:hypothetical protein
VLIARISLTNFDSNESNIRATAECNAEHPVVASVVIKIGEGLVVHLRLEAG